LREPSRDRKIVSERNKVSGGIPSKSKSEDLRESKGKAIAEIHGVRRLDANSYEIASQSGKGKYCVVSSDLGWDCSC